VTSHIEFDDPNTYEDQTPMSVQRAREGNRDSAFRVLDAFRTSVDAGKPPHPDALRYVVVCQYSGHTKSGAISGPTPE
jgi:hypothetical protein